MSIVADHYTTVVGLDTHAAIHTYALIESPSGKLIDEKTGLLRLGHDLSHRQTVIPQIHRIGELSRVDDVVPADLAALADGNGAGMSGAFDRRPPTGSSR